jgi:acyl-coenzyme A thioesterase PaaI-like protein
METTASQSRASDTQKMLARLIALAASPIGRVFFNRILARQNPYTAGIGAKVVELRPGYAKFTLKDRKKIRNHLNSIHAVALTNLGEMTSGLALNVGLPANVRCIVTQITTEYLKKARGTLVAESRCELPTVTGDMDFQVEAVITDADQEVVAKVKVNWRLGLRPEQP